MQANQRPALFVSLPSGSGMRSEKLVPYPPETLYLLFALPEMDQEQSYEFYLSFG